MINGKSLKLFPFRKKKLIRNNIMPHFWQILAEYSSLLGTHTVYDIPSKGGLTYLSGAIAGAYICVWRTCPPASLDTPETASAQAGGGTNSIKLNSGASSVNDFYKGMVVRITGGTGSGQYNIITGYNGTTKIATVGGNWTAPDATSIYEVGGYDRIDTADLAPHTSVIVTGLVLNSSGQPVSPFNTIKFAFGTQNGDYAKLSVYWARLIDFTYPLLPPTAIYNWKAYYSALHLSDFGGDIGIHTNLTLTNVYLRTDVWDGLKLYFTESCTWTNVVFEREDGTGVRMLLINISSASLAITNFRGKGDFVAEMDANPANVNFSNAYIDGAAGFPGVTGLPGYTYIHSKDFSIYGLNALSNYTLVPFEEYPAIFPSVYDTIDWQEVNWNDFISQTAEFSARYIPDTTFYGLGTKLYYSMKFVNSEVADELKNGFGDGWVFIVRREDFEHDLTGTQKYIKNFMFYNEAGCTNLYDFQSDENFLILAEDASGNQAVFVYMANVLYTAYVSDIYFGTVYTVRRCFQIWEKANIADGLRNLFKDYSTQKGLENSPIEGSIEFNNIDNEWVVR